MDINISQAEWKVMEVLWKRHPLSAAGVIEELARGQAWAPNTVRTMLARLVQKGALRFERKAGGYLYRPAVPREECVRGEVDSLLERLFDGAAQALLVHFVRNRKLTRKQIAQLREVLDQEEAQP